MYPDLSAKEIISTEMFLQTSIKGSSQNALIGKKPKILIFSFRGGKGHEVAAKTLTTLLENQYEIVVLYPMDEFFPVANKIYNFLMQYGCNRLLNFLHASRESMLFLLNGLEIKGEKIVLDYIKKENPDLIISVAPLLNYMYMKVAHAQGIPYLLIPTDNDLRVWLRQLEKNTDFNFKIALGYDLPSTRALLKAHNIPEYKIEVTGLPLRSDFQSSKNLEKLYLEYDVPRNKPVILLMFGGCGSRHTLEYVKHIGNKERGVHLLVCCGTNAQVFQKLQKIHLHPSNSISVLGYTENISDLMAMADLLITKAGPGTIEEAIAMKLPMLIDGIAPPLIWERANIDLVVQLQIGSLIRNQKDISTYLKMYLYDSATQKRVEEVYQKLPPNRFSQKIMDLINTIIYQQSLD